MNRLIIYNTVIYDTVAVFKQL